MSNSPVWKVYRDGEFVGSCKYPEDAAALVSLGGEKAMVKYDHSLIVWREGQEEFSADESYDSAAAVMRDRVKTRKMQRFARQFAP